MKTNILLTLLAAASFSCNVAPSTAPKAEAPPAPPEAATTAPEAPAEMQCGEVSAYVISKNLVKQAIRQPDEAVFPSFDEEFVEVQDGMYYGCDGHFFRGGVKVIWQTVLSCKGNQWEILRVRINGVDAAKGMNL